MVPFSQDESPPAADASEMTLVDRRRLETTPRFTRAFSALSCPALSLSHASRQKRRTGARRDAGGVFGSLARFARHGRGAAISALALSHCHEPASSHLRQARRSGWLPFPDQGHQDEGTTSIVAGPEAQVGDAEQLVLALAQVSPKYRTCLLLQVQEGFSQREIAQISAAGAAALASM